MKVIWKSKQNMNEHIAEYRHEVEIYPIEYHNRWASVDDIHRHITQQIAKLQSTESSG